MVRLFILSVLFAFTVAGYTHADVIKSSGQTVYAPVYSHIYIGNNERMFDLAVTLSIRNTSMTEALTVTTVDYYNTEGKKIRTYLKEAITVQPLSSLRYVIAEEDRTGGSGGKFIVTWKADKQVNEPIIETVMIGSRGQQGISFTSRGVVIQE